MGASERNPAAGDGRAPNSFCLAAERSDHSPTTQHVQGKVIGDGETVLETRASLLRDFIFEALAPVESDAAAARLCLKHNDDVGARYHLKRVVECVKAAASTFRELESLTGRAG
jgi:hypothetical protein